MWHLRKSLSCGLIAATLLTAQAQTTHDLNVDLRKKGTDIAPTMYGIFFEDINYAADGGLYAEMVKNRSFEFPQSFMGWQTAGRVELRDDGPFERNPHYVRLHDPGHPHRHTMLCNEGFFGMALRANAEYRFSVWARIAEGNEPAKLKIELADTQSQDDSQVITAEKLTINSTNWARYQLTLKPQRTMQKAVLRIFLRGTQAVDLEHISLFPANTWQGHENGLRKDLAQALADMHPGVLRFPGGCIVEGTDLATRYNWKNTIGPVENRPLNQNRWQYTFTNRFYPDYFQSGGLGFYEFFLLSEEIGAQPLPILNCGLACQYQNEDEKAHVPVNELQPYIDDAIDLIEFANGDTTTHWGSLRAQMGHAAPFNLKYIGIGNEQWGTEYTSRLAPFVEALRKAHPEIQIVGSSGPHSEGEQFDFLWPEMRKLEVDLVDEHFYRPEEWFLSQGNRYDNYPRKGPKVFAGEYACHEHKKKWNHFHAALLEAAFMTGLERNADVVRMATYAPLFAHVEGWQWRPDLIWFDNSTCVRTSSYYVQQLYALYKGTHTMTLTMNGKPVAGSDGQDGLFASAVTDADTHCIYVKVANTSTEPQLVSINLCGLKKKQQVQQVRRITLQSPHMDVDNTIENPYLIIPMHDDLPVTKKQGQTMSLQETIPAQTFAVYVFQM